MNEGSAKNGRRARAAVFIVFIAGMIVGGLLTVVLIRNRVIHVMRHDHPPIHQIVARRLTEDLDLSAAQRKQLGEILHEFEPRFDEFDRTSRVEVRAIAREMQDRIRTILTPEQQKRYDENLARLRERSHPKRRS